MNSLLWFKNPFKGLLKKDTSSRQVEVFWNSMSHHNQRIFIKNKDWITIKDYELICWEIQKDKNWRAITFVWKDSKTWKIYYIEDLLEKVELDHVYDVNEQLVNGETKLVYTWFKKSIWPYDWLFVWTKKIFSKLWTISDFKLSETTNDFVVSIQRINKNSSIYLNWKQVDISETPIVEMNVSKDFTKVLWVFKDDDQIYTIKLNGEIIGEHNYISEVQFNEKWDHYAYVWKDEYDGIYIDWRLWHNIGFWTEVYDMVLSPDGKSTAYSVRNKQTSEFSLVNWNTTIDDDFNGSEFWFSPNWKIWFKRDRSGEREELIINWMTFIWVKSNRDIQFSPDWDKFAFISIIDKDDLVFLNINWITLPEYTNLDLVIEWISDNNILSYKMYSEYFTNEKWETEERALEKPYTWKLQLINSNNEMIILVDQATPNIFKYVKIDNIWGWRFESKNESWLNWEFDRDWKYVIMNWKKYLRSILKI